MSAVHLKILNIYAQVELGGRPLASSSFLAVMCLWDQQLYHLYAKNRYVWRLRRDEAQKCDEPVVDDGDDDDDERLWTADDYGNDSRGEVMREYHGISSWRPSLFESPRPIAWWLVGGIGPERQFVHSVQLQSRLIWYVSGTALQSQQWFESPVIPLW